MASIDAGSHRAKKRVQRFDAIDHRRGKFARVLHAQERGTGVKQPRQRIRAQSPPRGSACVECCLVGRDRHDGPQQRERREDNEQPYGVGCRPGG